MIKNNTLQESKINMWLFVHLGALIFTYLGNYPPYMYYVIMVFLAISTIINPITGISFYLLYNVISAGYGSTDYAPVIISIGGIISCFRYYYIAKKVFLRWIPGALLFFCSASTLSLLNGGVGNLSFYIVLWTGVLICIIIYESLRRNFQYSFNQIGSGFIWAGYLAVFVSLSMVTGSIARLRLFDSVRHLANILSIAIIICIINILRNKGNKLINIGSVILFFIVILMTASRGVLYLTVVIIAMCLMKYFKKKPIYALLLLITISIIVPYALSIIPDFYDLKRIAEISDSGRSVIWSIIIKGNSLSQWIFGAGLSYPSKTYGWYSHSVFLDCAVSLGIIPFAVLIFLLIKNFKKSINSHNFIGMILMMFVVGLFIPHGSIYTTRFWIYLSVALGVINFHKIT